MKSAANRPTHSSERDSSLAGAPQDPPDDTAPDDAESLGEQTVTFRAIRPDDTAPPRATPSPPAPKRQETGDAKDTAPPQEDDAFAAFRAAAAAAISSVNEVAAAAQRKDVAVPSGGGDAARSEGGRGTASQERGATPSALGDGAASRKGPTGPAGGGSAGAGSAGKAGTAGGKGATVSSGDGAHIGRSVTPAQADRTVPSQAGGGAPPPLRAVAEPVRGGAAVPRGEDAGSPPADDAFAAFRAAAEAAISSVNEVAAAAQGKDASTSSSKDGEAAAFQAPAASRRAAASREDSAPQGGDAPQETVAQETTPRETTPRETGAPEGAGSPAPVDGPASAETRAGAGEDAEIATGLSTGPGTAEAPGEPGTAETPGETEGGGPGGDASGATPDDVPDAPGAIPDAPGDMSDGVPGVPGLSGRDDVSHGDDVSAGDTDAGSDEIAVLAGDGDGLDADEHGDGEQGGEEWGGGAEGAGIDRVREVPLPEAVSEALTNALASLRDSVTDLGFGLDLPGAQEARRAQSEILAQLDDYVIPRVHMSVAPALVVVAGSTGAGKSTLLNTLANATVSATGVRRPTTGTPVLACHPDDHEWFAEGDLLGSLRRREAPGSKVEPGSVVLVSTERLPPGVALLDTPDIDSVVEEHHEIAHRMLDAADLWIFVTTAARYADAPAWRLLRLAKERGARLAIVLSRVPPRSREVVTKHFFRMLAEYGLGEVDRFVVNESRVTDGMLPDHEVTELRLWLTELSVDDQRRAQAVQETLSGTLDSFRTRVPALARQLEVQVAFRSDLRGDVDTAYATALAEIEEATRNGSLLHGEVLARWQDFAGAGDLMRALHLRKPGRFAGKASHQAPERLSALKSALRAGLESVVVSAAERAAEEAVSRWLHRPGGESLAATAGLGRASDDLLRRTSRAVGGWQDHIIELIRTEGVTKRSVARLVSFDVESLALIFVVGLLGYGSTEAKGPGTGGLPQRLVHALLGAESLRTIGARARSDLRARIATLFDDETSRYVQALDGAGIPDESAATRLYQATYNLEVAR
ncbi:GTPase [Streptosporangium sp. NPDC006007]|uniref:GTPase n=1 Tax=Streptosporangium sp. NPDC006007 TaxID=3154575 RepID=UPI0033A6328E